MDLIHQIAAHRSVSVVGLAKNAGKTECLNYILKHIRTLNRQIAVTSVGVDGERYDLSTYAPKPEIVIYEGMLFVTSEAHYRDRQVVAELLEVTSHQTALGRLVVAKALSRGKVLLSGPADSDSLRQLMVDLQRWQVDTFLIDGALSRLSPASPAVTEALVLATGAAVSGILPQLVKKTQYVCDLIAMKPVDEQLAKRLLPLKNGIHTIDAEGEIHDLGLPSALLLNKQYEDLLREGKTIYVAGAAGDSLLDRLRMHKEVDKITLIVRDFTKVVASADSYNRYIRRGGRLCVLQQSRLLAVCVNPLSPEGYSFDSEELQESLRRVVTVPVYDIKQKKRG